MESKPLRNREIFGPNTKLILFTHKESNFDNVRLKKLFLSHGGKEGNIKVDVKGNVYVSGPGGLWILSPRGKHLGTLLGPRPVHNFAWGGADGKTLYMTARDSLYRMPLLVRGVKQ